jgi:CRISPR-associated protein Cmr2
VEGEHDGALIYAGGDDVLAFLPLHKVLPCAQRLANDFKTAMKSWTVLDNGELRSPTLSMGIAIVHQLLPLDEALAMVRKTEKVAKDVTGKNALAIVVKKRGGEAVQVEGHWGDTDERLRTLVTLHNDDAISRKAQYELMDLASRLEGGGELMETLKKVREAEARRLLGRKRASGGGEQSKETFKKLEDLQGFTDPARLGRELYVAGLLAQAERQANPPALEVTT